MKKFILVIGMVLLILETPLVHGQQGPRRDTNTEDREVMVLRILNLTEDQLKSVRKVGTAHSQKIIQLRTDFIEKRIEFGNLLRDSSFNEELIRAKGREMESIDAQLMREMVEYQIEIRKILNPGQVQVWTNMMEPPVGVKMRR
jgi:Spy/CpxP family protein refolding chaperone